MIDPTNRFSTNGLSFSVYLSGSPSRPGALKLTAQDTMSPEALLELP